MNVWTNELIEKVFHNRARLAEDLRNVSDEAQVAGQLTFRAAIVAQRIVEPALGERQFRASSEHGRARGQFAAPASPRPPTSSSTSRRCSAGSPRRRTVSTANTATDRLVRAGRQTPR